MFKKIFLLTLIISFFLAKSSFAYNIFDPEWDKQFKDQPELVQVEYQDSIEELRRIFYKNAIPIINYAIIFVALIFWSIYIGNIIIASGKEDLISNSRKNLLYGLIGFVVLSLAIEIGEIFTPAGHGAEIIDLEGTEAIFKKVISYLQLTITALGILMTFYAGFLFIKSHGEENDITTAKKIFQWGFAGIIISMIAFPLVEKVFYPASQTPGKEEISNFAAESVSFVKFLLGFLGILSVVSLAIAGSYYLTSFGNEERQSRAKTILMGTIFGIIIIITSYAILAAIVPNYSSTS